MADPYVLRLADKPSSVVVEVPHAGLEIPTPLKSPIIADERARRRDADLFVDQMWQDAPSLGAPLLVASISRYVCDLNRDPDDVDALAVADHQPCRAESPRGFIWRLTTEGVASIARPLTAQEWQRRVDYVWAPYHGMVEGLLAETVATRGFAILLSGHSMPSVGRAQHSDVGNRRADIVLGWLGGQACDVRLKDVCECHFQKCGYSVAVDQPYRGGATTARYGHPDAHMHAIQIEVSRSLYMNEDTFELNPDGMARLRRDARALLQAVGALDLRNA